jgi:hypothetical protein
LEMIASKQACFIKQTHIFILKNSAGYHKVHMFMRAAMCIGIYHTDLVL